MNFDKFKVIVTENAEYIGLIDESVVGRDAIKRLQAGFNLSNTYYAIKNLSDYITYKRDYILHKFKIPVETIITVPRGTGKTSWVWNDILGVIDNGDGYYRI